MSTAQNADKDGVGGHDAEKAVKSGDGDTRLDAASASASEEKVAPPPAFTRPDGGLEAWLVIAGGWLVLFSTFGSLNAFGVFQTYYSGTLGVSDSAISWIGSIQLFLMFAAGIVVGKPFDNGHGRFLLASGSILFVFSFFMTSLCTRYYQVLLAQGIGAGVGLGTMFLPTVGVVSHWFAKRSSLATGIVVSGASVGGLCFPIMLNHLFVSIGFAWTVRAAAFLMLGCMAIANVLIKFRLPRRSLRPANMQFPPANPKEIFRDVAYLLTVAGSFLILWGIFFPFFYLQLYADVHGVNPTLAFYMLSIPNATSLIGRILPNFLADKLGPFNMLCAAGFVTGGLIFVWLACTTTGSIIGFALLFGLFSGNYVSLLPSLFVSLSSHVGEIGVRMGIAYTVIAFAALTGTPITGALLGSDLVWWKPAVFSGTAVTVGTGLVFSARFLHARRKGTWKV